MGSSTQRLLGSTDAAERRPFTLSPGKHERLAPLPRRRLHRLFDRGQEEAARVRSPFNTRRVGIAILVGTIVYPVVSRRIVSRSTARRPKPSRAISLREAYCLPGLKPSATRSDVLAAYRNLMKRLHPDRGGTAYLAAKINEAKDAVLQTIKA